MAPRKRGWIPGFAKRSCSNKELEPRSDAIRTDTALGPVDKGILKSERK
jgi:hypothetical protein